MGTPTPTLSDPAATKQQNSWLDFTQKLLLIFAGFALTTICGAMVSDYYQTKQSVSQLKLSFMQSDIGSTKDFFVQFSQLMGSQDSSLESVEDALYQESKGSEISSDLVQSYQSSFDVWKSSVNQNKMLYQYYFQGYVEPMDFSACIWISTAPLHKPFPNDAIIADIRCINRSYYELNSILEDLMTKSPKTYPNFWVQFSKFMEILDDTENVVYSLNEKMSAAIQAKSEKYQGQLKASDIFDGWL